MDELSKRIAALSPAKRAILQHRLKKKGSSTNGTAKNESAQGRVEDLLDDLQGLGGFAAPPLRSIPREGPLSLSFAQQRLWIIDKMYPGSLAYNTQLFIRLEGFLSLTALESAIGELVRRHETLRTRFPVTNGEPAQEILSFTKPELKVIDLSGMDDAQKRQSEALRLAQAEGRQPFDLAKGPLVRWLLIRLDNSLHFFRIGLHHIISDGWSQDLIYRELAEFYGAAVAGRSMAFKELPVQYADFACWQRRWLSGSVIQEMLDYWKPQLAEIPRLELPADRPHAATPSFRGTSERIFLGRDTLAAINRLARNEGATLFMTLLTAFQALLQRYTGQDDIAVGSPIANRNRIEIEGIVGIFVNSLVLRADLSGDPTFHEALRRVREITLKAYEFQDMPFEKLVEDLTPERNFGQNPFFQIMFALQNLPPRQPLEVEGLRMSMIVSRPAATRFEIEVHLWEALEGLEGLLVYNPDRFDASRIARMVEHYVRILRAVSSKPDRKLSDLPMLSSEERERQLFEGNQTATPYPRERCIPYVAPQNAIEEQIAAIWSRLLNVERVGVHDNFFELGGHSLKLLKLLDVLEKQTGLWLRVIDVLENPTVAGMAAKLQLSSRLNGSPVIIENFLVRLRAGGQKPLFIIPGGWGGEYEMLVFCSMFPFLEEDMPVYGILSRALDEAWPLPRDLRAQTAAVLKAIRHVEPHGPYIILGACIASPQAVEVAIQAEREGECPGSVILLDAAAPSRPPLLAAFLRRLGFDRLGWKRNKITTSTGDPVSARMANYFELLLNWNPAQFHSSLHLLFSSSAANPQETLKKWKRLAKGAISDHYVTGDHRSFLREQIAETGAVVNEILARSLSDLE